MLRHYTLHAPRTPHWFLRCLSFGSTALLLALRTRAKRLQQKARYYAARAHTQPPPPKAPRIGAYQDKLDRLSPLQFVLTFVA